MADECCSTTESTVLYCSSCVLPCRQLRVYLLLNVVSGCSYAFVDVVTKRVAVFTIVLGANVSTVWLLTRDVQSVWLRQPSSRWIKPPRGWSSTSCNRALNARCGQRFTHIDVSVHPFESNQWHPIRSTASTVSSRLETADATSSCYAVHFVVSTLGHRLMDTPRACALAGAIH